MRAPFVVFLGCLALPAAAAIETGTARRDLAARADVHFRVVIPPVLRLRLDGHPRSVRVEPADVERGEVVVEGARVEVATNLRRYDLHAEVADPRFAGVTVAGLAPGVREARVTYRLRLAPGTGPGEYPWPVSLTLQQP